MVPEFLEKPTVKLYYYAYSEIKLRMLVELMPLFSKRFYTSLIRLYPSNQLGDTMPTTWHKAWITYQSAGRTQSSVPAA